MNLPQQLNSDFLTDNTQKKIPTFCHNIKHHWCKGIFYIVNQAEPLITASETVTTTLTSTPFPCAFVTPSTVMSGHVPCISLPALVSGRRKKCHRVLVNIACIDLPFLKSQTSPWFHNATGNADKSLSPSLVMSL